MKPVLTLLVLLAASGAWAAPARLLVISGIGGDEVYSQQFRQWGLEMTSAARDRLQLAGDDVVWLCETPRLTPGACTGEARRGAVLDAVTRLATTPPADAPLMVLLIGHGTARDGRALFNLPGPDLAADDLSAALDAAGERRVAVVNTSPSSAPFIRVLSRPGRSVVTATAHAAEDDHTRFAAHFVAAYAGSAADTDKNGRVSLLEAFRFAVREVGREYTGKQQLATEHALLDDNGDGEGSREAGGDAADGVRASGFYLASSPTSLPDSPRREILERQARALVEQVALLRQAKAAMAPERYQRTLEALLVALALNRRALREEAS